MIQIVNITNEQLQQYQLHYQLWISKIGIVDIKISTIEIVDTNNVRTLLMSTIIDNSIVAINSAIVDIRNSNS